MPKPTKVRLNNRSNKEKKTATKRLTDDITVNKISRKRKIEIISVSYDLCRVFIFVLGFFPIPMKRQTNKAHEKKLPQA